MEMYLKYCKKCLMPNTRPNIKFNDDGTCSACINFEKQKTTDWDKRWMELEKICDRYRGNTENDYDCAIAVSGGKDSHFQTYIIKEKLKMNPLLISVGNIDWTETGRKNLENLSETFGVDIIMKQPNRKLAKKMGGNQIGTVGVTKLNPGLVNVIAKEALLTVDLRNTDEQKLKQAENKIKTIIEKICKDEGVSFKSKSLARFEPVTFDRSMVLLVSNIASKLGFRVKSLPSGAGHDAQMFAPNCPTGMIFVPSHKGISHNVREFTEKNHIQAGANVLLQTMLIKSE